ncbi:MAG TPA: DNA recombination protein RmuC [Patescibacteria group bacterium]|nr:DNA recombination protein RmuC [Patescibacteria group bacterium]
MDPILLAVAILLLAALATGFFILLQALTRHMGEIKQLQAQGQNDKVLQLLNENMRGVQDKIDRTTEALNTRLDRAAQIIGQVNRELGSMSEIGRGLKDFQAFLSSPKLRGNLGEQILYEAIDQVFSSHQYVKQFKFKDGQIVDAIIKTSDALIPIDSKFPMESFKAMYQTPTEEERIRCSREFVKQVKKHIDDVARKYILPHEGTVDFAVMYVPSENVYYEIVANNDELMDYAKGRSVLLVSPNSFFHFLRVILMGLERSKIQEQAQKIWELLKGVQQENAKFGESLQLVNRHLTNAKNALDSVGLEYTKISNKLDQVQLIESEHTPTT